MPIAMYCLERDVSVMILSRSSNIRDQVADVHTETVDAYN